MTKRTPLNGGFTLLEVLVAMAILGSAILMISSLFSRDMRSLSYSADYTAAVAAAQDKLREVLADDSLGQDSASSNTAADTTDGGDGYNYDVSVHPVLEEKTGSLNCRLMEVDVTVHWIEGARDKSFTLKTLKEVEKKV